MLPQSRTVGQLIKEFQLQLYEDFIADAGELQARYRPPMPGPILRYLIDRIDSRPGCC